MTDVLLDIDAVEVSYGQARAVNGATVRVPRGSITAIVGPNGAGKTSLLKAVSGLQRVRAGEIRWDGQRVDGRPSREIAALGIAHVPESRRLFPRMSVEDNLKMGGFMPSARPKFRNRLEVVYALFPRLHERRRQLAGSMSGGEQQMCAIGRALMSEPKLLLLDEPSAGLAPVVVDQVFELLRKIRAGGVTVLIVEQNVQQVLRVVDRAYLLKAGSIRAAGTAAELLDGAGLREAYLGV
jgi:branched-chain amino acid transport system ATP-binding protein